MTNKTELDTQGHDFGMLQLSLARCKCRKMVIVPSKLSECGYRVVRA